MRHGLSAVDNLIAAAGIVAFIFLLSVLFAGCDSVSRATAGPVTVHVNLPPAPKPEPAVPTPSGPQPGAPDLSGATDVDDSPGIADGNRPCDNPGRGDGNGTPGNGKGRGDERGACL